MKQLVLVTLTFVLCFSALMTQGCEPMQIVTNGEPVATTSLTARGEEWLAIPLSPNGREAVELRWAY